MRRGEASERSHHTQHECCDCRYGLAPRLARTDTHVLPTQPRPGQKPPRLLKRAPGPQIDFKRGPSTTRREGDAMQNTWLLYELCGHQWHI